MIYIKEMAGVLTQLSAELEMGGDGGKKKREKVLPPRKGFWAHAGVLSEKSSGLCCHMSLGQVFVFCSFWKVMAHTQFALTSPRGFEPSHAFRPMEGIIITCFPGFSKEK